MKNYHKGEGAQALRKVRLDSFQTAAVAPPFEKGGRKLSVFIK